jgi:thymidylate synthase
MKHIKIDSFDCTAASGDVLRKIWYEGETYFVGYGSERTETKKLNITIVIDNPENRPLVSDKAPNDINYVTEYFLRDLWLNKEKENTSDYTYGELLREPIDQVQLLIDRYVEEFNDRQCTMVLRRPEHIKKGKEPPCLSLIDTEILDNKLHLTCYFRSWDAFGALPSNIAALQMFNEGLVDAINCAKGTNLTTGKLIFHSKNCHIYKRNYKLVEQMLNGKTNRLAEKIKYKKMVDI